MEERRKFKRKLYCLPVIIKDEKNGYFYIDYTTDISEGGLLIHSDKTYPPGTELELAFRFPDSINWINSKCSVVWSTKKDDIIPAMGLRFKNLNENDRRTIKSYLKEKILNSVEEE